MVFRNLARTTQYEMAKTGSQIEVFAFALLPNHFHFILWQYYERDMVHFMRSLTLKYVKYVNEEYERVGNLFMRPYKARLLYTPVQVAKATRYVLQNPVDANLPADWKHVGTKL
ncbi:hypothetical protein LRY65_05545 [Candidatus Woesebacteria bacterium]|nr:hypothetical protein [Candidatus Woesebacteria bacterium]MCD8546396.1 hypothetical protein [Candidatus Woesebacteria bacterium]